MHHKPIAAGGNSYHQIDSPRLFDAIQLRTGMVFVDVACGFGNYALAASHYVGPSGRVYAVDLWLEGLLQFNTTIKQLNISTAIPLLANATRSIPLRTSCADICLLATVLHDFVVEHSEAGVLTEISRVLKPGGHFAIIEFEKVESQPGPPISIRLIPESVTAIVSGYGFRWEHTEKIGSIHYLSLFINDKAL